MRIIGGEFKRRELVAPKGLQTRPTSSMLRETLFNICQMEIEEADFLDLCAGSGAIGFEALSRGAASVTFVENQREACLAIEKNIHLLKVENRVIKAFGEVLKVVKRLKRDYNLIYIDPPYRTGLSTILLEAVETEKLLRTGGRLFIEEAHGVDLPQEVGHLYLIDSRKAGKSLLWQYTVTS